VEVELTAGKDVGGEAGEQKMKGGGISGSERVEGTVAATSGQVNAHQQPPEPLIS
jgi:hypothetical protein